VGCQIGISKYLTRKGHTAVSRIKEYLPPTEIRRITHRVYRMIARLSSQDLSRHAYPVLAGTFWRENIIRGAILRMHRNGVINSTQVKHKIVQVGIVLLCKRTNLGLINIQGNPFLLFLVLMLLGT
jgi:hypothetical protein